MIEDFGDCSGKSFVDQPAKLFNGKTIRGCFAQERVPGQEGWPKAIFPEGIEKVTFVNSNLDNVLVPKGVTLVESSNNHTCIQKDGWLWYVDKDGNPTTPTAENLCIEEGMNTDPAKIPGVAVKREWVRRYDFDIEFAGDSPKGKMFYKVEPVIKDIKVSSATKTITEKEFLKLEGKGEFDEIPERNNHLETIANSNPKQIEKVVVLQGPVTHLEVEGEVFLFKDKDGKFHG